MKLGSFNRSLSTRGNSRALYEALETRRLLSFSPAVSHATIGTPSAIVTADFNDDGNLDLATCANATTGSISVFLGDGGGGFGPVQRTVFGTQLSSIAVADINRDTRPDIVVADNGGFSVLMGNGDGTFQSPVYSFGGEMVAVGDFNSDGNADVLVTWLDGDWATHIQVYLGNGQGAFASAPDAYYWGYGGVTAVDLNHDGKLDVATSEGIVFLGNGDGSFQFDWNQQPPVSGRAITTGDLTGEGDADAIVVGNSVAVLRGTGVGAFHAPVHHSANGTSQSAAATADFNADGKLDAIVTDNDIGTVSVMLGNGDGTLRYFGAYTTGTLPSGVVVGDFNGDGRPDVAVSNAGHYARTVSVLLNDGDWLTPPPPPPPPPDLSISDVTVTEGDAGTSNATFTLTLSRPATLGTEVYFNTASITALAGSDFEYTGGLVIFDAGQTSRTLTVPVRGDLVLEPTETFAVNLVLPTNLRIADAQGMGTIIDNDPFPAISISNVSRGEGNSGTTPITFTVSLSSAGAQDASVRYATASGSAISTSGNRDFLSTSGTLSFPAGVTSQTVTVSVVGDTRIEPDETFSLNLSQPVGVIIVDGQGVGTILNDDSGRGKHWVGPATGGSWFTGSNWSPSGVPDTASLVTIADASVVLSASASVSELVLIGSARLTLAPNGNRFLRTAGLFLDAPAALDLGDNAIIIDYQDASPLPSVRAAVNSGYANGAWNGYGIFSSTAVGEPGTGVYFADAPERFASFPATFAGLSVDATSILLGYTLLGDASGDRRVNLDDFAIIAANYNQTGRTFARGNFDYDLAGDVNLADFAIVAANFNRTLNPADGAAAAAGSYPFSTDREALAARWEDLWPPNVESGDALIGG